MHQMRLDDLRVDSFETQRGSVFAHWRTQEDNCRPPYSEQDGCRGRGDLTDYCRPSKPHTNPCACATGHCATRAYPGC